MLAVAGALSLLPAAAGAQSKSFDLLDLSTEATVNPDASMDVVEQITYDFRGGPFNFGIRSFIRQDRDRITDFEVSDSSGRPLDTIRPSNSESGDWEWRLGGISDETETYTIRYHVAGAVKVGTDVGELYWQFVGEDHTGIDRVNIVVHLPGSFPVATESTADSDATVVRAWGHGPRNGTVHVAPDRVLYAVSPVPAHKFVEARIAIPATAFTADAVSGARLPDILDEEGEFVSDTLNDNAGRRSSGSKNTAAANAVVPAFAALGLAGLGATWVKFGREPKPDPMIGKYWREPLEDPPGIVLANLAKGTPQLGPSIGATLIDLAQRGYLSIREERQERFGPDKVVHVLTWRGKPTAELAPYERELLQHIFLGRPEVTTDDVTAWAKANQTEAKAFAKSFQAGIKQAYDGKKYRTAIRGPAVAVLALSSGACLLGWLVSSSLGGKLGFVSVIAAIVIFAVGMKLVANRSQRGADEAAKAESLKQFLKDFSNLEEAPAGHLILWERFLVYAVTLGVADDLMRGLQTRLPAVVADPHYAAWYASPYGPGRRFDRVGDFPSTFGAATATAFVPPSRSGSGGGFSGGGGGGGGGGGFGAR
jgi:uncharacterized membrane protein